MDDSFFVLKYSRENFINALNAGEYDEDGVESAFEAVTDVEESVRTGQWVGDCFIYTNSANRLNYLVGDQTYTVSHFDQPMYVLGYLPRDGRVYVADRDVNVVSFGLSLSLVEYQTLVLRGDMDTAAEVLQDIPKDQVNKIARFLEGQGYKDLALEVATDPEHRFELALSLNNLDTALEIARQANVEHKWKTVGDAALSTWNLSLAQECFTQAKDFGSLLLLNTANGDTDGLRNLAEQASGAGLHNVAFSTLWTLGDIDGCIDQLVRTNRLGESVLFSQTYKPSRTPDLVARWKKSLETTGKSNVANLIGIPPGTPDVPADDDLFPKWDEYLTLEKEGKVINGDVKDEVEESEPAANGTAKEDGEGEEEEEEEVEEEESKKDGAKAD